MLAWDSYWKYPLSLPLLQSPNLILSSVSEDLLWPLLALCPHSQKTKKILVVCPALLLLWIPPALHVSSLSQFINGSSQYQETHSTWNPHWPHLVGSQKHCIKGNSQPPHSTKIQRWQQNPRNKTHIQHTKDKVPAHRNIVVKNIDA